VHQKTVLFCGPIDSPLNSGRYMIAGMKQLGYEVIGYDYRTNENHETELAKIALEKKPDYIFILKGEKLSADLIRRFKELKCKTILWFTMVPIEDWMIHFAKAQDFVITNVEDHLDYFRQRGIKNIKWIHQGFSPEFFEIDTLETKNGGKCYADVAMIGSMGTPIYNKRCELVLFLKQNGIDIKWWGPHLSRDLKNIRYYLRGVHRLWAGSEVYMKDFADVIRHTKIFIGDDSDIPIKGKYLSNRSLAVVGCGGFYLCRRTRGIEYLFDFGSECDVFETKDEMLEKVRYYLDNEDERKRIALKGQQKILNNYTYKNQMKKIFDWVNKIS
jgi:spore maturation protein CgeB